MKTTFKNLQEAASYHVWWGTGENCLLVKQADKGEDGTGYGPGSALARARALIQQAPALLKIRGPRGEGRIVGALSGEVIFVRDEDESVSILPAEIGGFTSQKVAHYVLRDGSPSQWVSGCYHGGAFALTRQDAIQVGLMFCPTSMLPNSIDEVALFGSNVAAV